MTSLLQLLKNNTLEEELKKTESTNLLVGGDGFERDNINPLIKTLGIQNEPLSNDNNGDLDYNVLFVSCYTTSTTKKAMQNNASHTAPLCDKKGLAQSYLYGKNFGERFTELSFQIPQTKCKKIVNIYCTAMPDTMLTAKMIHLGIQESKKWKIGNNTIRRIAYLTKPNPKEKRLKNVKQFEITVEQSNSYAKKLNEIFKGGSIAESFGKNFRDDSNNQIYIILN